jgi:hypothetical protein
MDGQTLMPHIISLMTPATSTGLTLLPTREQ